MSEQSTVNETPPGQQEVSDAPETPAASPPPESIPDSAVDNSREIASPEATPSEDRTEQNNTTSNNPEEAGSNETRSENPPTEESPNEQSKEDTNNVDGIRDKTEISIRETLSNNEGEAEKNRPLAEKEKKLIEKGVAKAAEKMTDNEAELLKTAVKFRQDALNREGSVGRLARIWDKMGERKQMEYVRKHTVQSGREGAMEVGKKVLADGTQWTLLKGITSAPWRAAKAVKNRLPGPDFFRGINDWNPETVLEMVQLGVLDSGAGVAEMVDNDERIKAKVKQTALGLTSIALPPAVIMTGPGAMYLNQKLEETNLAAKVRAEVKQMTSGREPLPEEDKIAA